MKSLFDPKSSIKLPKIIFLSSVIKNNNNNNNHGRAYLRFFLQFINISKL